MKKMFFTRATAIFVGLAFMWALSGCTSKTKEMEQRLTDFIKKYEQKVEPMFKEAALAYFTAAVSGKKEDYTKYENLSIEISKIFANKEDFATIKEIKESGKVKDELLVRQMEVIYNSYLGSQIDEKKLEEMIKMSTQIEQKFNTFRAVVGTDTLSDNDVEEILRTETNSDKLKAAWMAHKNIGPIVAQDIIALVKMRNAAAKELGFNNFHEMSLKLSEQDPDEILKLFDELDNLTRETFAKQKDEIDAFLAAKLKIDKSELMPWHYQNRYFQEAPAIYQVDLDKYYKDKNLEDLTKTFYGGMGMDITDLLANSDLYEKPGKNQHAFCIDIDQKGDVKVLCNIVSNSYWMNTMLHEFGHASYDKYTDITLPYTLRDPAHTFTTEAIAQIMGRFASSPQWLLDMKLIDQAEKDKIAEESFKVLKLEMLVFSRWSQVMYRFEKGLYENPDQDLNKLWWDIVEKYQMIKRPVDRNSPDWATKIHIATSPCYYHNYLMGELLASQLYYYITKNIIKSDDYRNQSFVNNPEVGKYIIENIFMPGKKYHWNMMIEKATGEKLTAKYYAEQFVDKE